MVLEALRGTIEEDADCSPQSVRCEGDDVWARGEGRTVLAHDLPQEPSAVVVLVGRLARLEAHLADVLDQLSAEVHQRVDAGQDPDDGVIAHVVREQAPADPSLVVLLRVPELQVAVDGPVDIDGHPASFPTGHPTCSRSDLERSITPCR